MVNRRQSSRFVPVFPNLTYRPPPMKRSVRVNRNAVTYSGASTAYFRGRIRDAFLMSSNRAVVRRELWAAQARVRLLAHKLRTMGG